MEPLDIYVLGAGASFVHGAPLTNEILCYALTKTDLKDDPRLRSVRAFLKDIFHFSVTKNTDWQDCPGLVDVLSIVDMALDRKENLTREYNQERLRKVRQA